MTARGLRCYMTRTNPKEEGGGCRGGGRKGSFSFHVRLQNSPYFCGFKYARAVKQKVWNLVWNEAENRERDWRETHARARAIRAHKTLTPRVTDFFTDFEEKTDCFAV